VENETMEDGWKNVVEKILLASLERNIRYIPALTCEMKNFKFFDASLSSQKSIKLAIPFNISDPVELAVGKSLPHARKVFTSQWIGLFAIPPIAVMFAAFCCYRRYV
jgi:hypothetical protein